MLKAMSAAVALGLVTLPNGGWARQDPNSEAIVLSAYSSMRDFEAMTIMLAGTEQREDQRRTFSLMGFFAPQFDPRNSQPSPPLLELFEMEGTGKDAALVRRWVGTGDTFWVYDFRNRQYSAATYEATRDSTGSLPRLLSQLQQTTSGPSSYVSRVLTEAFAHATPRFLNWAPGQTFHLTEEGEQVADPIVATRNYTGGAGRTYFLMGAADASPRRSIAFQLDLNINTSTWNLNTIFYAERNAQRVLDWFMNFTPGAAELPEGAFTPYSAEELRGWVAVPVGKRGGL